MVRRIKNKNSWCWGLNYDESVATGWMTVWMLLHITLNLYWVLSRHFLTNSGPHAIHITFWAIRSYTLHSTWHSKLLHDFIMVSVASNQCKCFYVNGSKVNATSILLLSKRKTFVSIIFTLQIFKNRIWTNMRQSVTSDF